MLLFLSPDSKAQNPSLIGTKAMSMGYASACLQDEWSVFNNVAGKS
jgi:hypothetical protein